MSSSPGAEPLRPAAPRVVIADDDAVFRSGVRDGFAVCAAYGTP